MFRMSIDEESNLDSPLVTQVVDNQPSKALFAAQVDPFISQTPAKAAIKTRTISVTSMGSNDSKNLGRIDINFDDNEVESPPKDIVSVLIPASTSSMSQTDSQSPPKLSVISTIAPTSTAVTQPTSRLVQHPKAAPTTSVRPLDPVIETAESIEAFSGDVMDKLKEMRENKG